MARSDIGRYRVLISFPLSLQILTKFLRFTYRTFCNSHFFIDFNKIGGNKNFTRGERSKDLLITIKR